MDDSSFCKHNESVMSIINYNNDAKNRLASLKISSPKFNFNCKNIF